MSVETANAPAGVSPPPAPQAVSPAPAQAPASSLTASEKAFTDRAPSANTPAAIRALIKQAKAGIPNAPEAPKPEAVATPAAEPAPEAPAEGEVPAGQPEETTETAEDITVPSYTGDVDPEATDGADDNVVRPTDSKRPRIRLPENDEVGRLAAAYLQRNRDMTLEAAMQAAKNQLGIKSPAAPEATSAAPKSDLPASIDATDKLVETLEARLEQEQVALNFEAAAKTAREIRKLERHTRTLERDGEKAQAQALQSYQTGFNDSVGKAKELYAFVSDPESPAYKRMAEIEAAMEETGDALYHSSDKPLKLAQMVAGEFSIPPRRKGAPPAPAKAAAPAKLPPPKQTLVNGGSRTTQAPANAAPAINAEIAKISNPRDFRNFMKPLLRGR